MDTTSLPENFPTQDDLLAEALEARLERIEEMLGDLHTWMRSEQVGAMPAAYRRLFSHLVAADIERRLAATTVRAVHEQEGPRQTDERVLNRAAGRELTATLGTVPERLATIAPRAEGERPEVIALVGSSGAGKTTMMYKLAVRAVLARRLRVRIVSCDTYKIGSVEGVRTVADILGIPYGVAFEPEELSAQIADADLVIVDTAGRSDRPSRDELRSFLAVARPDETHLVLSATMSQRALQETAALFLGERLSCVSFTKLDEAPSLGSAISAAHWMALPLGYLSVGTVIPDDILPAAEAPLGEWAVEGMPQTSTDGEARHV